MLVVAASAMALALFVGSEAVMAALFVGSEAAVYLGLTRLFFDRR